MIFLRDRQSIFFSLFFPVIFMTIFGFVNNDQQEPFDIGVVKKSDSVVAADFVQQLKDNPVFNVTIGTEDLLRSELRDGNQTLVMVTHDAAAASRADRVLFLADGKIVEELSAPSSEEIFDTLKRLDG